MRPWTRWRLAALALVVAWCGFELGVRRTAAITDDWQGWRQADTQAIARNFLREEANPLYPRIDWRGDGPGYVESEAQLYPALIGAAMRVTGESVWPGQLLSLACVALAAWLIFAALARRFGEPAALLALAATLLMQGTIVVATSIQPDTLSFLAFTLGWFAFVDWLAAPTRGAWLTWIAATALAGLVKPTTLELGLAQGVYVLLAHRAALRNPRLWAGWAIVVGAVAAYLIHAHRLYAEYGNTFGVLSGGDSKLPAASALRGLTPWRELARYAIVWGVGLVAVPAALYLVLRRRLGAAPIALAVAALALDLLAFRYTAGPFGTHYHLPHIVLGAWLVAAAAAELHRHRPALVRPVVAVAVAIALVGGVRAVRFVRRQPPQPETVLGEELGRRAAPGTLVAVRARAERYNTEWHTTNNFEDPRVFYLSRTKGWVLANEDRGAARLAEYAARGARFYVHVHQKPIDPELANWLGLHATLVFDDPAGRIYELAPATAAPAPAPPTPTTTPPPATATGPRVVLATQIEQRRGSGQWSPASVTIADVAPGDALIVLGLHAAELPADARSNPSDDRGILRAAVDQGPAVIGRLQPPLFAQIYLELDAAPGAHTITPPALGPGGAGTLYVLHVRGLREHAMASAGELRVGGGLLTGVAVALSGSARPGDLILAIGGHGNTAPLAPADVTRITPGWDTLGVQLDGAANLPSAICVRVATDEGPQRLEWTWTDRTADVAAAAITAVR